MSLKKNISQKAFYITTTLPYVNAEPHIGFAMELVRADIIARWRKISGADVFFNTGTDEHGIKIYRKAQELEVESQKYVDRAAERFKALLPVLGISEDVHFIRTTDFAHKRAAQEFWRLCDKAGDIYKKNYKIKYCIGCELEKTESELIEGKCPLHPDQELEIIEEENYFFKFSKYQEALLEYYQENPNFVVPNSRFNEIKRFVESGLEDFSISRLKSKMPWGVDVPNDSDHVMYVWFDALVSYISTLNWPENKKKFKKFWEDGETVQYAGKDNLRQQAAMWQAMLFSASLPNTGKVVIDGFILGEGGVKMSKSSGNTVNPFDIVGEYGVDALRYFLAREISTFEDYSFNAAHFKEVYNANLANGLGNLVSRVMKMAETHLDEPVKVEEKSFPEDFISAMERFEIQRASDIVWGKIQELDATIQKTEPFKLVKLDKEKAEKIIVQLVAELYLLTRMLDPILPETSQKIIMAIGQNKSPSILFPRKE